MSIVYLSVISMAMILTCEFISDSFNVVRICNSENYAQSLII